MQLRRKKRNLTAGLAARRSARVLRLAIVGRLVEVVEKVRAVTVRRQGMMPAQPGVEQLKATVPVLVIGAVQAQVEARQDDRTDRVQQRAHQRQWLSMAACLHESRVGRTHWRSLTRLDQSSPWTLSCQRARAQVTHYSSRPRFLDGLTCFPPAIAIRTRVRPVFRVACRRLRSVAIIRRRLAGFLLVWHVVALHGLPMLHQAFHRNNDVHEHGGLRWLQPRTPHVHAKGEMHEPSKTPASTAWPRQPLPQRLRPASDAGAPPLHPAFGPAHGSSVLLALTRPTALAPAERFQGFRRSRETVQ